MNDNKIGRNQSCPCESGLKYKHCHGDPAKIVACQQIATQLMARLIQREQMQKGLIPWPWQCDSCNKGFPKPVNSTIKPGTPLCPECGSSSVVQNVRRNKVGEDKENQNE